jgi:hypothetical protein
MLFEKIGEVKWIIKTKLVSYLFHRQVLIGQQSLGLRGDQAINDVLGGPPCVQLRLFI